MKPHHLVLKIPSVLKISILPAILLLSTAACAAQQAELRGRVFSSEHVPIPAASVALHCALDTRNDAHTTTLQDGSYKLSPLAACSYQLSVAAVGYLAATSIPIDVKAAQPVSADVVLKRESATASSDRPSFQAAGIHGLIDPGGYSASATAGAASNVLHDISGVQRESAAASMASQGEDCKDLEARLSTARQHLDDWKANAEAGRSLLNRNAAASLPYLLRADAIAPTSAIDMRLDLAEALILAGKFREASTRLASLSAAQADPRYDSLRARAEEGLGNFSAAIRDRATAMQQSPTPDNIFALAYEQLLAGQLDDANLVLRDGLARHPQSVSLLVGLAAVQFFEHKVALSLQTLLQASRLDPQDRRPYPLLADISRLPDVDTAGVAEAMEQHLAVDPNDARGNAALGSLLVHRPVPEHSSSIQAQDAADSAIMQRAARLLQHALALDPSLTQARSDLALLYHRQGDFRAESAELVRVAAEEPSRNVQYRLGMAYRDSGQSELAKMALNLAREAPDSPQLSAAQIASLLSVAPAIEAPPCSSAPGKSITPLSPR